MGTTSSRDKRGTRLEARARARAPAIDADTTKQDAIELIARAKRLARIELEIRQLQDVLGGLLDAEERLGYHRDEVEIDWNGPATSTLRVLADTGIAMGEQLSRLWFEHGKLERQGVAALDEDLAATWRRLLMERDKEMSASKAARIVGGHGDHVRTSDLPPGERRNAARAAEKRLGEVREHLTQLRGDLARLEWGPRRRFAHYTDPVSRRDLETEIERLEKIESALSA